MSSFGALAHIRYVLTKRMGYKVKVGHAGTLDPLATGVLILCTGRATKKIEELQRHTKEYVATLQFGATTASFDMEHPVSACNVNGKRAYTLMRKGREVKLEAKPIRIEEIELQEFDPEKMQATIRVVCGKGTYIRSLARDIGEALGSGAYLTSLRRTRVGDATIDKCHTFDTFEPWLDQQTLEG